MGRLNQAPRQAAAIAGLLVAIGAHATVLSWIGFGVKLQFERESEWVCFPNHRSYHAAKHAAEGSFVEVDGVQVHIGNPL
jgi:hypothetical protein